MNNNGYFQHLQQLSIEFISLLFFLIIQKINSILFHIIHRKDLLVLLKMQQKKQNLQLELLILNLFYGINIGIINYELYFGENSIEKNFCKKEKNIVLKNLKQLESNDLDDLVSKLLILDKYKILVELLYYIHHQFF